MFVRKFASNKKRPLEFPFLLPFLLALALAATVLCHGARGLYESTEGRYAECAREMAQTGTWLKPVLNGHPHWTKPPLTYWAIRVPYRALGPTTWAARLYLIPCFLVTVAAVWWLTFRLWGDRPTARMGAIVYATSLMPLISNQVVSADYLLTATVAVAQACFWEGLRKRSLLAIHLFWLSLGVAFLVKGPPALLVVPAVMVAWYRLPRQERTSVPLFAPTALILFLAAACSWYVWEARQHPGLMEYWLKDEVVNRSLTGKFDRNPAFYSNFTVYLPVLFFGSLPWSCWLVFRWRAIWARVHVPGGARNLWRGLPLEAHWVIWALVLPMAVFMLSHSKMPLYVLPLFVPFAAVTGRLLLVTDGPETWFRKRAQVIVYSVFVCFVAGKAVSGLLPHDRDMLRLWRMLTEKGGVHDATRLAVSGGRPLNGLSYYFDSVITNVPLAKLAGWAAAGGERYLLCTPRYAAEAKRLLAGATVDEQVLSPKRHLLRFTVSEAKSSLKR
jgi:4-amino-4-deoxy-L-arabinose transferase